MASSIALAAQGCAAPMDGADEDEIDLETAVGETSDELRNATCPKKATQGDFVICVKTSKWSKETLVVYDRQGAARLWAEATTSQQDGDGPRSDDDEVTCKGGRPIIGYQAVTWKKKLKNFFGFGCNGQGVHYYPQVGAGHDSHGCVRIGWGPSEWMRENIVPALSRGTIYIYIE